MKLRGGSVLGKKTILKSDHFPGCQNKRLSPHIDGAPNYRQVLSSLYPHLIIIIFIINLFYFYFILSYFMSISLVLFTIGFYKQADSLHVHGVAIPKIDGIRNVLKHIGAQKVDGKGAQVLWINLREEPVITFLFMHIFYVASFLFFF